MENNNPDLTDDDWREIFYALELKVDEIQRGRFDFQHGEVHRPGSETSRWAKHLLRIMEKIGPY